MIRLKGVIERVQNNSIGGWIQLAALDYQAGLRPRCIAKLDGAPIGECFAQTVRADLTNSDVVGLSFSIKVSHSATDLLADASLLVECVLDSESVALPFWRPLEIAHALNTMAPSAVARLVAHLLPAAREQFMVASGDSRRTLADGSRRLACVVTYANDAGAWFPYFYRYYASILGAAAIFVVTPSPHSFHGYELGGVTSVAEFPFDDVARSRLMSGIASGLQAYFQWSIVCDVDEIIVPHPGSMKSFVEILATTPHSVLASRGLDVVQKPGESSFDFGRGVLEQREYAVPNSAMSKPHFSRVPVVYSGGFHFCDKVVPAPQDDHGFLTLHLKWACADVRAQVQKIVSNTQYADAAIQNYCFGSVDPIAFHPKVVGGNLSAAEFFDSPRWIDFDREAYERIRYIPDRGLYFADFAVAPFLLRLPI